MRRFGDKGRNRIWILTVVLGLILLFSGCADSEAARGQQETAQEPAGAADREEGEIFWTPRADSDDGLQRALTAAVQIAAGGLSGSGVIYEETEDGLVIVTAGHVMADAANGAKVTFYDGWEAACGEYRVFGETDCAFLMVSYEELAQDFADRYVIAEKDRETFDDVQSEDSIFLADPGNENGFGYRFALLRESWIYVEDFGQYMMILSGAADAGMSGSGVFDEYGCFLGILCGENEDGELAVLPYSIVDAMYQQMP